MADMGISAVVGTFEPIHDDAVVALGRASSLGAGEMRRAAGAIRARLGAAPGSRWGVYLDSPFTMVAALKALQSLECSAVLLPHAQRSYVDSVRARVDGLLTDATAGVEGAVQLPSGMVLAREGPELVTLDWNSPIGFLTSGSSGEPSCVYKEPSQLRREIAALEACFGAAIENGRVVHGTASHQHLYGFTFRIMWPYLTGRPFADTQIRIPSDVSAALRAHGRIVLVSSPSFLARARRLLDRDALSEARLIAFSSGGPLDSDTADWFNGIPGVALTEIYGSTETGALAHRVVSAGEPASWRPLPGVRVTVVDGRVLAWARHFADDAPVHTADRAELAEEGGFRLLGRADQIVKVGDKRVSLTEIERLLDSLVEVDEARVLQLADGSLGAVVALSHTGWDLVRINGKRHLTAAFRRHLARHLDRVTTPKRWRLVRAIARNTQGKVELAELKALFGPPGRGPVWQTLESGPTHWRGTTLITPDLDVLQGHFPTQPILPGVAQLQWAGAVARVWLGVDDLTGGLQQVKFRRPIEPVRLICLIVRVSAGAVEFTYADGDLLCSSGRLLRAGGEL